MDLDIIDTLEIQRYSVIIHQNPVDIWIMNIGENLSLSFNNSTKVKPVENCLHFNKVRLIEACFIKISNAATNAFIFTIPTLLSTKNLYRTVRRKKNCKAFYKMLLNPVKESFLYYILLKFSFFALNLEKESSFYTTNL